MPSRDSGPEEPERLDAVVLLVIALKMLVLLLFAVKGEAFLYQGF